VAYQGEKEDMTKVGKYSISAVAVAGLLGLSWLSLASTSPAHAASTSAGSNAPTGCTNWDDGSTFGVSCASGTQYQARAQCSNGQWLYGQVVAAPDSSYVYCSSVGATYVAGSGSASDPG
jgi:hypothetical protein